MARQGTVLQIENIITEDHMACKIADMWQSFQDLQSERMSRQGEVRNYIFATSTAFTSNSALPWKNKTTIPKLCQIRDNIYANYIASLFPKRKWVEWEGDTPADQDPNRKKAIEDYMMWACARGDFKKTVEQLLLDWIDTGNCFSTVEWTDETIESNLGTKVGYVGPSSLRIGPNDIQFNPTAYSFRQTPKIIRSFVTLGDLKKMIEATTKDDNIDTAVELFNYFKDIRSQVEQFAGDVRWKDNAYSIDGFSSYHAYFTSDYAEILTFYGDIYNRETDELLRNKIITVVDRHRLLDIKDNPTLFGYPQIFHCGWRKRPDNLWSMGPLDNLVGLQYRIDHLENLKADVFDLIAFPVIKVKGAVDDFDWGPGERIYVSEEGDVEMVVPEAQIVGVDLQIAALEQKMEEMAGAPKEALGFRTPGEKTKYEVQRLENAASRIFQNKIETFEEQVVEPLLAAMLELARRRMTTTTIRIYDPEFDITTFQTISAADIQGSGRLRPVAARHFAEKAEKVQNATAFFNSQVGMDPAVTVHISGLELARMFEDILDLEGYNLVVPYIRVTEQADAMRLQNSQSEQVMMEAGTPTGLTPEDSDEPIGPTGLA